MKYPVSDVGAHLYRGKFTDGDPAQGVEPSVDKASHMNAVYDEMIAIITAAGLTPNEQTFTQVRDAINQLIGLAIATRAPADHHHAWSTITEKPTTFTPASHIQPWNTISEKPATFPPSAHGHGITDISGLIDALNSRPLSSAFSKQLGSSGYQEVNGGWKFQMIQTPAIGRDSVQTITLPDGFPNAFIAGVGGVIADSNSDGVSAVYVYPISRSQARVWRDVESSSFVTVSAAVLCWGY